MIIFKVAVKLIYSYLLVSATLRGYDTVYNAILPSNNHRTLHGVSPDDCGKSCNQETGFQCRSFDYHSSSRKCYLSKAYRDTVAVSHPDNTGYDYYELSKYKYSDLGNAEQYLMNSCVLFGVKST